MKKQRTLTKTNDYLARAEKVLPALSSCYSRAPLSYARGSYPAYVEEGKGCLLYDVDGNEYIDTTMALCPVILGYSHENTQNAVKKHLNKGPLFTLPHRLEIELAEMLVDIIPCAEMARFGKNGADVTSAAIRLSRQITGKNHIALCGYHGWHDWYISTTDQNGGIPKEVGQLSHQFKYNDIDSLRQVFDENPDQIACVIMEPMSIESPNDHFLENVKKLAHEKQAILIFDEIVTGFRWSLGGAQEHFKVTPDLATFSKCIANGFPISALVGRAALMQHLTLDKAFWSTTYGNESLSMAVALETIQFIKDESVIPFIWQQGEKLLNGFNQLVEKHSASDFFSTAGAFPRHIQLFKNHQGEMDLSVKTLFQQECVERGLITLGCHNVSFSHSDHYVEKILAIYDETISVITDILKKGDDISNYLKGPSIEAVFK